jgi:hypothetical protein
MTLMATRPLPQLEAGSSILETQQSREVVDLEQTAGLLSGQREFQLAQNAAQPAGEITQEIESEIRAGLYREMASNSNLHGAWIDIAVSPERNQFLLRPIYDGARIDQQKAELTSILEKMLPSGSYKVDQHMALPVSAFLEELQDGIEGDLSLAGCLVDDAYFKSPEGDSSLPELMLLGRTANNDQKDGIANLAIDLLNASIFAGAMSNIRVKPDEIEIVVPSSRVANYMFNDGVNSYFDGEFEVARRAFDRAVLESPNRLDYKYWRVVAEIAEGDMERAYKHIQPLAALRRGDTHVLVGSYDQVLYSLERVQGPVRQKLHQLERRALYEGP